MNRKDEITRLLQMSEDEIAAKTGKHLRVFADCNGIHQQLAEDIGDFIKKQNVKGDKSRFILPVGPVEQYPILLKRIHQERISLKNCWFFFMDEYADQSGIAVSPDHPLSFQKEMREMWLNDLDPELAVPESQIFFPDEKNIRSLAQEIEVCGGLDFCFGGIGIHGHVAFNEPEIDIKNSGPRMVELNDFTVTINTIRSKVGGNLEGFPKKAYTLGMKQILGARKIRLVARNGISLDWANTVLRLTLFGKGGDDYPCTYINKHTDYVIYTDRATLAAPEVIL